MKKNFKSQSSNVKFAILVGIAVLLGVATFNRQTPIKPGQKINPPGRPPSSSALPLTPQTFKPIPLPANLTEDEKFILNPPPADASRSALNKHAQTVAKLAKKGNTLELNNCQPNPLVLQVTQGDILTIKNNNDNQHKLMFDEEHVYQLPNNNSLTLKAQFKYGTGDYGYVCEGREGIRIVGFLHVVL